MKLPARLLLVPSWMMNKINNSGENTKILADLTKLSNIFTVEDVAFYISINNIFQSHGHQWMQPLFSDVLDTFLPTDIYSMTKDTIDRSPVNNNTINSLTNIEYLDRVKARSDGQLIAGEYWSTEDLQSNQCGKILCTINRISSDFSYIYVYSLIELTENVFGLIIKPLNTKEIEEYKEEGKDLYGLTYTYNTLLESISKFFRLSELAQTSLFKGHVMFLKD